MAEHESQRSSRRSLLKRALGAAGLSVGASLAGCTPPEEAGGVAPARRLRAAFSSAGLQGSWNRLGRDAAMLWGRLLDVDVTWYDGEFDGQKQRQKIDAAIGEDWDFFALQAHQIGILEEPVRKLKKRGIPVIAMDTLIVEKERLRDVGVWMYVAPDHVHMAEMSTQYLVEEIGGRGQVIHIGGQSGHSGARDRQKGFNEIVSQYPEIELVGGGVQWCDWDRQLARKTFESLLKQSEEPIAGAFFHNDDMALACVPALSDTRHEGMVVTAVDGQKPGLEGVRDGKLAATAVNPTCMIHGWSLIIGQFLVRNQEKLEDLPLEIICPSPLVARGTGNLDAMFYLSDPNHCLI